MFIEVWKRKPEFLRTSQPNFNSNMSNLRGFTGASSSDDRKLVANVIRARGELTVLGRQPLKKLMAGFEKRQRMLFLGECHVNGTIEEDFYYDLVDHRAGGEFIKRLAMNRGKAAWLNHVLRGTGMSLGKVSRGY